MKRIVLITLALCLLPWEVRAHMDSTMEGMILPGTGTVVWGDPVFVNRSDSDWPLLTDTTVDTSWVPRVDTMITIAFWHWVVFDPLKSYPKFYARKDTLIYVPMPDTVVDTTLSHVEIHTTITKIWEPPDLMTWLRVMDIIRERQR